MKKFGRSLGEKFRVYGVQVANALSRQARKTVEESFYYDQFDHLYMLPKNKTGGVKSAIERAVRLRRYRG